MLIIPGCRLPWRLFFMKISRSVSCLTPSRRKRSKNYCWKAFGRRRIFTIVSLGWRKKSDKEEPLWRNYRWDLEWHSRKTPAQWNIFQNRPRKSRRKFWHTRIQFNPAMKCMPMCRALAIFKPTAGAPRGKMATLSRRHGEHRIGNARQPSLDCPPRSLYPIE